MSQTRALTAAQCAVVPLPVEGKDTVSRPDIEWIPSYDTYVARVKCLEACAKDRPTTVPEGWPAEIHHPRVWSGCDFQKQDEYTLAFTKEDIAEIEEGLASFKAKHRIADPDTVSRDTFPLPNLGPKLDKVSETVHDGIGFTLLRGLDPTKYTRLDNVLIYAGITSHVANQRGCQDYDGRMLVHIQDIREDVRDYAKRGPFSPYTSRAQPFHTDRCDILALYAYDVSPSGGESLLASNGQVYNELAASRPDIIHELAADRWIFDEFHNGDYHVRPLLHQFSHGPGFAYSRRPLTGAWFSPHYPGVPAMTEDQAEALDAVHFTAEKHALSIRLQPGDIEIVNNFALFHARRGFVDGDGSKRHLMRLWLRSDERAWKAPDVVTHSSREIYDVDGEFRSKPVWDIFWSPPLGRGVYKRMDCN